MPHDKTLLILSVGEDISPFEIMNVTSQTALYGIVPTRKVIQTKEDLPKALFCNEQYDYLYLACHGCESSWGNKSGTLNVSWIEFGAMICKSGITKPGAVLLHSCCRGGLHKVAYDMFACCEHIEYVCGPRQNLTPDDIITTFNLLLYYIERKSIHPVRAAQKVESAIDITLVCHDRADVIVNQDFIAYCRVIQAEVDAAFGWNIHRSVSNELDFRTPIKAIAPDYIPPEVLSLSYESFIKLAQNCNVGECGADYRYMQNLLEKESIIDNSGILKDDPLFIEVQRHIVNALKSVLTWGLNKNDRELFEKYLLITMYADNVSQLLIICKDGVARLKRYSYDPLNS